MSNDTDPFILSIETATRAGSVSLTCGEAVLGSLRGNADSSHSTDLIENVDQLLHDANVHLSNIDLFAAASGPGSFTGLRIGLATVKSLAICMGRKCAGVSTLAAIAYATGLLEGHTVALLPAGRGEVFAQMFWVDKDGVKALDPPAHATPGMLLKRYGGLTDITWAGEGAHLLLENLRDWTARNDLAFSVEETERLDKRAGWTVAAPSSQLAVSVGALALIQYRSGEVLSPEELQASYVRASDAEINERWQQEKAQPSALI